MSFNQQAETRSRKRSLTPDGISLAETKRRRRDPNPLAKQSVRHKTAAAFWDKLSRLHLTHSALQEFDRRTAQRPRPLQPKKAEKILHPSEGLKHFAKRGGPNIQDLMACPEPVSGPNIASNQSKSQTSGKSPPNRTGTRKTRTHDPNFEQHLMDHGIYPSSRGRNPSNLDEIKSRLAQPRPSLSLSRLPDGAFEDFRNRNEEAQTEAGVMSEVFPIIAGGSRFPSQQVVHFRNLAPLTDGTIVHAKPDLYDGSYPTAVDANVRASLKASIVPSANTRMPCLPNFFVEGKGPGGSTSVAKRQACYDGAIGARAIHATREYIDPTTALDNNAYTIASTYSGGDGGGFLTLYTIHPEQSQEQDRQYDYRMTQIRSFAMTDGADAFLQGATALRNARDWAQEQRSELISQANQLVQASASSRPATALTKDLSQSTLTHEKSSATEMDEDVLAPRNVSRTLRSSVREGKRKRNGEPRSSGPSKKAKRSIEPF